MKLFPTTSRPEPNLELSFQSVLFRTSNPGPPHLVSKVDGYVVTLNRYDYTVRHIRENMHKYRLFPFL